MTPNDSKELTYHGGSNPRPPVQIAGHDGNAYAIIGRCKMAARKAGWSEEQISSLLIDMFSGNYDHLLQVALHNFEVD
jgi:hypothetical protein